MRRISAYLIFSWRFCGSQRTCRLRTFWCQPARFFAAHLDEPNFSSATADIGDPVICHLSSLREFGQNVFPAGKLPRRTPGGGQGAGTTSSARGYLKLEFDRIGFPTSDVPVPAKVIAAKGYKVDRRGDIVGRGHATRDVVEWLIPPLWPWKIITLPKRGPRPHAEKRRADHRALDGRHPSASAGGYYAVF